MRAWEKVRQTWGGLQERLTRHRGGGVGVQRGQAEEIQRYVHDSSLVPVCSCISKRDNNINKIKRNAQLR